MLTVFMSYCVDLATRLLSLARNENLQLYKAFAASMKSKDLQKDGLDEELFLLQAKGIANEHFKS